LIDSEIEMRSNLKTVNQATSFSEKSSEENVSEKVEEYVNDLYDSA